MRESLRPAPSSRRSICRSAAREPVPVASVWGCQGAMILRGKLFEYCSDDAPIFGRYERCHLFQNSDLFGAQCMLLRKIPICHLIPAAITTANRFYWVREHELVQIILHRPNADVKFHSQVRGRVKAPAQQCLPYCALTLCYFRVCVHAQALSPSFVPHKVRLMPKYADMVHVKKICCRNPLTNFPLIKQRPGTCFPERRRLFEYRLMRFLLHEVFIIHVFCSGPLLDHCLSQRTLFLSAARYAHNSTIYSAY